MPKDLPEDLPREFHHEFVILRRSRTPLTRSQLRMQAEPAIKDCLAAVCLWDEGSWEVGDHRFAIFSVDVAPGIQVYVQFWSEPDEPVLWEVSSGEWNPPTDEFVNGAPARHIESLGFAIGGEAQNYGMEIDVPDMSAAATLARKVVDLFYDAFGYRGQQPFKAQVAGDARAELRYVHSSLTPDDLVKLLRVAGLKARVDSDDDEQPTAVVTVRSRGVKGRIVLTDRADDGSLFQILQLGPDLRAGEAVAVMDTGETLTIPLYGGVTVDWLLIQFAMWFQSQRKRRRVRQPTIERAGPERLH